MLNQVKQKQGSRIVMSPPCVTLSFVKKHGCKEDLILDDDEEDNSMYY